MNCIEVQNLLSAYIDDQCTTQEENMLREHLDSCPACLEEYKVIESIVHMTHQIEEVDLPESFHSDLMIRIHNQADDSRKKPFYKRVYGSSIVAAALLFFVVFGIMSTNMLENMTKQDEAIKEKSVAEDIAENETTNSILYDTNENEAAPREAQREDFTSSPNTTEEFKEDGVLIESNVMNESTETDSKTIDGGTSDSSVTDTKTEQNALILSAEPTADEIIDNNYGIASPPIASKMAPDNKKAVDQSDSQEMELLNETGKDTISNEDNDQSDTFPKALKWFGLALLLMIIIPIGIKLSVKGRN